MAEGSTDDEGTARKGGSPSEAGPSSKTPFSPGATRLEPRPDPAVPAEPARAPQVASSVAMDTPLDELGQVRPKESGQESATGAGARDQVEEERDSQPESRKSVSLGPLALLGFGADEQRSAEPADRPKTAYTLLSVAALVVVVAGLKVARPVMVPFMVSVFIATLSAPAVFFLRRKRWPVEVAVTVVVIAALLIAAALGGLVLGTLNSFVRAIPEYQERLIALVIVASQTLQKWGIDATPESLYSLFQPAEIIGFVGETLSGVADMLSDTFLVALLTVFILFEALVLPQKIRAALADPNADLSRGLRVVKRIKAYVVVKTSTSLATGLIIGGLLWLFGVDFALLWGLLAFLLNFIPNIGSVIAAIPAVLLALLQFGLGGASLVALVFLMVNMVIGSILEPRVMGKSMNLSPLIVFLSLVFWGWLWGGVGMLLSVPLTMAIRIMLDGNEATRPLAILMAGADSKSFDEDERQAERR